MIYDYSEKEGYVSLWIGKCKNYNMVDEYLSTVYFDDDFNGDMERAEQSDIWKNLFIPANRHRDCENERKELFNYEFCGVLEAPCPM